MAYDQQLAMQVRAALSGEASFTEREMFGGIGFMLSGNMACGVIGNDLIVRVGPEAYETELNHAGVKQFDMTGRPMRGWVLVTPEALSTEASIHNWVKKGLEFARSLPAKSSAT
ncbi:MAG: TfoX/Sxy family protein [Anaerolineales bacterium]|jgi:TfoX/Sxy family transcriptional regulator of competence genes